MKTLAVALALAFPVAVGSDEPAPPVYRVAEAPERLAPAIAKADAALDALQLRLAGRLMDELRQGGPTQAIGVCRDEAASLTAETARAQGVRVGRTSHRLRNPGNVAPSWATALVEAGAGRKGASVEAMAVDLGDRVGVLRPIVTGSTCLQCHGPADRLAFAVKNFLEIGYPADRAVGFEEGDLRGFAWAEAPAGPSADPPAVPAKDPGDDMARGKALFGEANPRCLMCHSAGGKGNPNGPGLDGIGRRLSRDEIRAWIRTPAEMAKKRGSTRKPAMVPYPEFTDDELDALVAYLSQLPAR
jgi:mono/diheme cytochrome c family protein